MEFLGEVQKPVVPAGPAPLGVHHFLTGTPTQRPVTERPVTKHPVTKRPVTERPVYETSRIQNVHLQNVQLQNVQDTIRPGHKTSSFLYILKLV
jgi:hypothetical protein